MYGVLSLRQYSHFLHFSAPITKVMYSMEVDGVITFPANDAPPLEANLASAISSITSIQVSTQSVGILTRADQMFDITIQGDMNPAILTDVEYALTSAWQTELDGMNMDTA